MEKLDNVVKDIKTLDETVHREFDNAAYHRRKLGARVRLDGNLNVIASASLLIALLMMVFQISQWTTRVDIRLDALNGLMAQVADNTRDIKELREEELKKRHDQ